MITRGDGRPVVVVVGGGYAGTVLTRALERALPAEAAETVLVSPHDYMLYTALLPQVASGVVEPRHLGVALRRVLRRTRLETGEVTGIDLAGRSVTVRRGHGGETTLAWDRLVLAPGSVTRFVDVPGLREHARELKELGDAVTLRDHVLAQLERAEATQDRAERAEHATITIVGAGYTGTELAAQLQWRVGRTMRRYQRTVTQDVRIVLLDVADRVLPAMDPRLGQAAHDVLRRRGVDVRLKTSVTAVTERSVTLSDGTELPTRTLVWCAGVVADPLVSSLGLTTVKGRLVTDARFRAQGAADVFALGDAAGVPDLTQQEGTLTAQTAQHAIRQGKACARNVAASLGHGEPTDYRHSDLGFVVDLGGPTSVANPLHVPVRGVLGALVTRGYHLYAMPTVGNRLRVATDWVLDAALGPQLVGVETR